LSHEPAVGFAADAAARVNSTLGVAAVTYGAGALNVINPIAAAYAEKSPVVVISGAPSAGDAIIPRGVLSATLQRFVGGIKRLNREAAKSP
jgi:indolepyruvate decarboxylase